MPNLLEIEINAPKALVWEVLFQTKALGAVERSGKPFYGSLGSMVAKWSIYNGEVRVSAVSSPLFGILCNFSTLNPGEPFLFDRSPRQPFQIGQTVSLSLRRLPRDKQDLRKISKLRVFCRGNPPVVAPIHSVGV